MAEINVSAHASTTPTHRDLTLWAFEAAHGDWIRRQPFNGPDPIDPLLGMVEEVGELSHAVLKARQGIRGTAREHRAAARDAVGDILIYMVDYCRRMHWSLAEIAEETGATVFARDWTRFPKNGLTE